jgi:hypothetical protein
MKCIIYGCNNKEQDGVFYDGICAPCYIYLTTGVVGPTNSFLNGFYELRKYAEELKLPNKNITIEELIKSHRDLRKSNKEYHEKMHQIIKNTFRYYGK